MIAEITFYCSFLFGTTACILFNRCSTFSPVVGTYMSIHLHSICCFQFIFLLAILFIPKVLLIVSFLSVPSRFPCYPPNTSFWCLHFTVLPSSSDSFLRTVLILASSGEAWFFFCTHHRFTGSAKHTFPFTTIKQKFYNGKTV